MKVPTTLEEANSLRLDISFHPNAFEAELHAATLTNFGRNVVAVFEQTLPQASKPLHLVCAEFRKHQVGPLGTDRKKA